MNIKTSKNIDINRQVHLYIANNAKDGFATLPISINLCTVKYT